MNESYEQIAKKLGVNYLSGLTEREVKRKLKEYGYNKIKEKKKESIILKFINQFKDFMIIILVVAAIVSALISFYNGSNDYIDSVIIVFIVVLNAILGLIQEQKAEKSLDALKKLSAPQAKVKRDNIIKIISTEEVVPGDIIILEAGNYVPADARLTKAFSLKVEESSLTGENEAVLKNADAILKNNIALGDMVNMVFSTTIITNGHGEAIVTDTGMNTKVGKIAHMIMSNPAMETPLQKKLENVGKVLGIVALSICVLIFFIGIIKQIPLFEMFMIAVGLAVAAIPEGLPAIVTIVLSIGVTKMAKKNAIIRKLPAVETLGSSTIICSDKTGTLTQNKMEVTELYTPSDKTGFSDKSGRKILEYGSLCNDSILSSSKNTMNVTGDPTEVAIVNCLIKSGRSKKELDEEKRRISEIPFDSTRKLMTTIHRIDGKYLVITKGAPDELIKRCNRAEVGNEIDTISGYRYNIESQNKDMSSRALRVLGVAYNILDNIPNSTSEYIEKDLIFIGLIGMIDPPRQGVKEAVLTCSNAGIKTVMITGDHILTAKAIAKELGILKEGDNAITGSELDKIPQNRLNTEIMKYSVFARVSPEHKVKIVKAFQALGNIVAMTGDGVNDAPALKNADIGIAMGKGGTDVAKSASDIILTDDNFVTIVEAVKIGRNIFNNIQKAIHFLLATNIGEIVIIFLSLILGYKSPLLAIQLLWINLITDSLPAIALGLEPIEKGIMYEKPRNPKKSIFSGGLGIKILNEGIMIGIVSLMAYIFSLKLYNEEVARTIAFATLSMTELFHAINLKSKKSILNKSVLNNKYLIGSLILGMILQFTIISIEVIAKIFEAVPLNTIQWIIVMSFSFSPVIIMEISKYKNRLIMESKKSVSAFIGGFNKT